jgi:hypothetical protein
VLESHYPKQINRGEINICKRVVNRYPEFGADANDALMPPAFAIAQH